MTPVLRPVAAEHRHLLDRKGAARIALIPDEVLQALNAGAIPTANLNEFLAIDLAQLAPAVAQDLGLDPAHERLQDTLTMLGSFKPMKRHGLISHALYDLAAQSPDPDAVAQRLITHPSDVARCWAGAWGMLNGLEPPATLPPAAEAAGFRACIEALAARVAERRPDALIAKSKAAK